MSAQAKNLSFSLLEAARGIGIERGVDLVLHVLFVRWLATQVNGTQQWASLVAAPTHDDLVSRFARLDMYREDASNLTDAANYTDALRRLVDLVDDNVDINRPVPAQRNLIADTFDETLGHLGRLSGQFGESDTPLAIADLMAALTVRPGDQVLDPVCGNGTGLLVAAQSQPDVTVSGLDINSRIAGRASMRLMVHDIDPANGFGVRRGDAFEEYNPGHADVVLAQPPWNVRLTDTQKAIVGQLARRSSSQGAIGTPKGDMAWLLLALDALRPNGRAAIGLSVSSLMPRFSGTHEHLLRSHCLEAIITLPPGVFQHAGVRSALWLLRDPSILDGPASVLMADTQTLVRSTEKGRVEFVPGAVSSIASIMTSFRTTGRVDAPGHVARVLSAEEIDVERGLEPRRYLSPAPEETVVHPEPEQRLLTEVELSNFKAFQARTLVPLAPLTLVYGANSAGKSSILQSLLLIKQSRDSDTLVTQGQMIDVGGFKGVVHGHSREQVEIAFTYGVLPNWISETGTPEPTLLRHVAWKFGARPSGQGGVEHFSVRFGEYELGMARDPENTDRLAVPRADLDGVFRGVATGTLLYPFDARRHSDGDEAEQKKRLRSRENAARRALRYLEAAEVETVSLRSRGLMPTGEVLNRRALIGPGGREEGIATSYVNRTAKLVGGVAEEVAQLLESLVWLGPLRSAPQRVYDRADSTGTPGDGRHVAMYLFDHATVVEQVNDWLRRLEVPYSLDVIPVTAGNAASLIGDLVAISLTDTRTGVDVTPADVGFGVSQVLPIVVELLARRDSVIAIEQPETHLHPRLQASLADLFINTTEEGGQGNQLIVETHSEHIMLRVQRRIREGTLDPGKVSVIYVDQDESGHATVQPLRIGAQGEFLDEWPQGFFDERLEELFGLL